MAGKTLSESTSRLASWGAAVLVALALVLGLWWWRQAPVALSDDGYDVALALYSVCMRKDETGLRQIEAGLAGEVAEPSERSAAERAFGSIIEQARGGEWEAAARSCRTLLDQQVREP